jgi:hypothetical protein
MAETNKTRETMANCWNIFFVMGTQYEWTIFTIHQNLAQFMKSKNRDCVEMSHGNRKNIPLAVNNKKMKTGEHCGQHSEGVAILLCKTISV